MSRRRSSLAAALLVATVGGHARADEPDTSPLSLESAVQIALAQNPSVKSAVEEIRRAEAAVKQVRSASLPTLTGNGAYTHLDGDRVLNGNVISAQDQISGNLTLAVPLIAARSWMQWSHARDNVDVSKLSASEARRQLAVVVARTYLGAVAQHRVVEVAERARVAAKAHFEYAHARYAGGYGTRIDEVRAQEELASDEAAVEVAWAQLTRLRESLGVLLGADHGIEVDTQVVLPEVPAMSDAVRDAGTLRLDVRLSQLKLAAAKHVRRDDWADYLPTLGGTFQPFVQNPPTLTVPLTGWQAQLVLTVPLYDGGYRYGQALDRKALVEEARLGVEGGVRQAVSDVRVAVEEVKRAAAALGAAREAARLAADGLNLSNLAYRAGASTNIEVIDAERRARDADTGVAIAEDADRQGRLDLLIASGRFPSLK